MTSPDWQKVIEASAHDVRRLSYVTRYSSIPVSHFENVAEHQYWVALYAGLIHHETMPGDKELFGPILLKAITHDLAECVTGDVVRTFKYSSRQLKAAIDDAEEKIVRSFPDRVVDMYDIYPAMFRKETPGDEPIAAVGGVSADQVYSDAVVKAADFLSLQQYMNREWLRGNREIEPFFQRMINDLKITAETTWGSKEPRVQELAKLYEQMALLAKASKSFTT